MLAIVGIALGALIWASLQNAATESEKMRCITNERRISSAILLYCQDHDGRLPLPDYRTDSKKWRHWFGLLQAYLPPDEPLVCPLAETEGAVEARNGYAFPVSYALNERFFGVFSAGPFPLENLELPQQTVLLAETRTFTPSAGSKRRVVWSIYQDIAGRASSYPAPHGDRMNVAAADGHVVSIKPAHYQPNGHDPLLGRLGGTIYNWNGGHPNGDTAGPSVE